MIRSLRSVTIKGTISRPVSGTQMNADSESIEGKRCAFQWEGCLPHVGSSCLGSFLKGPWTVCLHIHAFREKRIVGWSLSLKWCSEYKQHHSWDSEHRYIGGPPSMPNSNGPKHPHDSHFPRPHMCTMGWTPGSWQSPHIWSSGLLLTRSSWSGKGQVEIFVPTTYLKQQLKLHFSSRDLNNRAVPCCITIYLEDVPLEKPEGSDPRGWPHPAASLLPVQLLWQMWLLCQSRLQQIMGLGMQPVIWLPCYFPFW